MIINLAATPMTASGALVPLARVLEEQLRACSGVAGLDARSRLYTLGREGEVRGVRLNAGADGTGVDVALELVGLEGFNLPEAGTAVRTAVKRSLSRSGRQCGEIAVRFTDIAASPLPLQEQTDGEPAEPEMGSAESGAVSVKPEAVSEDPKSDLASSPAASSAEAVPSAHDSPGGPAELETTTKSLMAAGARETVRISVSPTAGRRTVLLITVEVLSKESQ